MSVEGEELFYREVNLCHQQLDGMSGSGNENKWTHRFDSRTQPPTFGEFLQNSMTLQPRY